LQRAKYIEFMVPLTEVWQWVLMKNYLYEQAKNE